MDENLKKIIPFAKKYKSNVIGNISFNILYALFGTLGMVFIMPVLSVLFDERKKDVIELPEYTGFIDAVGNWQDYIAYYVKQFSTEYGVQYGWAKVNEITDPLAIINAEAQLGAGRVFKVASIVESTVDSQQG